MSVSGSLTRYRIIANVVGVALVVLVFVAMPLKYFFGNPVLVEIVGPLHGFLYMVYLLLTLMLCIQMRWSLVRTVPLLLAGTIPFMSFIAERKATQWVREEQPSVAEVAPTS